jgi:hypothetical protein
MKQNPSIAVVAIIIAIVCIVVMRKGISPAVDFVLALVCVLAMFVFLFCVIKF